MAIYSSPLSRSIGSANTRKVAGRAVKAAREAAKFKRYREKLSMVEQERAITSGTWSEEQRRALIAAGIEVQG